MLDEKLNALIKKYGIYDEIGGLVEPSESQGMWHRLSKGLRRMEGEIHLVRALNATLDTVPEEDAVAWWGEGKTREKIRFWMLSPKNRKKIRYIIQDSKKGLKESFYGRRVILSRDIEESAPQIKAIILMQWESTGRHANLIWRRFEGEIIDINELIREEHLQAFFTDRMRHNPYADIFIARHCWENADEGTQKQLWHKRLIAHYIRARDFLSAGDIIKQYKEMEYEDTGIYLTFWDDVEKLFLDIRNSLLKRKQRDVFVHWLDQMDKEDFYSMPWVGNPDNGQIFHRAYTTMTYTTAVMKSIISGENVKSGKLMYSPKENLLEREGVHILSHHFDESLGRGILHRPGQVFSNEVPAMVLIWYALDMVLKSSEGCAFLLHFMETHQPYSCGEISQWQYTASVALMFFPSQSMDFTEIAKVSREYLDRQLKWYYKFLPPNSVSVYMSDHGHEIDLSEKNINMPFKILGKKIMLGEENRLFSYKDLYKLIDYYMNPGKNLDDVFTNYVVIDNIDPYNESYGREIREYEIHLFNYAQKRASKEFLRKYMQATKVVTAEGEYYTINILGEENYYRDKECTINLIDNPAYAERIAELREKAGKFYNPWKEKRQVAIDFYEYLGIEEKDILAQCY